MAQKGSKYARKHRIEASAEQNTSKTNIQNKDNDLWDILYNPGSFSENFQSLGLNRQIDMINLLHEIVEQSSGSSTHGLKKDFARVAEFHLDNINKITQSSYDKGIYCPLSNDEKKLIRMDCYGSINKRHSHQLSELYKFFLGKEKNNRTQLNPFKFTDYDIDNSPSWRVFNQFESFRKIKLDMQLYFYNNQINPDALKVMTVSDFCDAIYNAYKTNSSADCACFAKNGESLKQRHVKLFMKYNGHKLENILINKGIDRRCVKSLCNAMKRFGVCEVNSISVTEINYTKRIIKDLEKAGFDVSGIQEGDVIPQNFTNYLIDRNQAYLILARDENGNLLDKSVLPAFELHHKHAVRFSASNGYLARANYPNNLLLAESKIHARYLHLFDKVISNNKTQTFYSRLNVQSKDMSLLAGFSAKDIVFFDMEKDKEFLKREAEDKKYRVNYFDMMNIRLQNEQIVAEKYKKSYSRGGANQAYNSWKEISSKIDMDKNKMQAFKTWLLSVKHGRKM